MKKQPVYLHSMLATSLPSHSLRSNNDNSLSVPMVKTNTGTRAFHSWGPSLWNNLPVSIHSAFSVATFKKHLKTHLFDLAFPPLTPARPVACWYYRTASSDFAVEHWFGSCTTEPGFAGDISAIEIWLIVTNFWCTTIMLSAAEWYKRELKGTLLTVTMRVLLACAMLRADCIRGCLVLSMSGIPYFL